MPARRLLALLIACLVPLAAACSSGDDGAKGTTTTSSDAKQPATTNPTGPTTTIEQLSFQAGVERLRQNLTAAGGDVCALVRSLGTVNVADPTSPDEAKEAVDVVTQYLDAIANSVPGEANTLHQAAKDFRAEAEAANYDVKALSDSKVMNSAEVGTALSKATEKCSAPPAG